MKKLFFTIELTLVAIVLTIGVCACSSEYADDETGSSVHPPYQKPEETPPAVTFFEVDGIYYNVTSQDDLTVEVTNSLGEKVSGTYLVLGWHGNYTGKVTIPKKVSYDEIEYTITAIGIDAFWYCTSLTSITLPDGVSTIDDRALTGCTGLEEIKIDEDNPYYCDLEGVLFSKDMTTLISVPIASPLMPSYDIPNSVTTIGYEAFVDCTGLTSVKIPDSVTTIESQAFYNCSKLSSIIIPNSVRTIGNDAFYKCTSLTGALNIPYGVITIGSCAFENCSSLTSLTVGNSVATIGSGAFRGCSGLTSVTISNGATSIESEAFYECTSLKELSLGNYITSIGDYAFAYCYDINEIVIPSNTLNVGEYAFYGAGANYVYIDCREIGDYAFSRCIEEELTLGENVNSIGDYAFYLNKKLKIVYSLNPEPPECGDNAFYYVDIDSRVLYVPTGSYNAYATADQWKKFLNIVEI